MPKIDKYYGTYANIYGDMNKKIHQLGYKGFHNQFKIVCKAKSMAEANRKAENYGLGQKVFKTDYTSETGNKLEIEMADKYGFIVSIDGTSGNKYVSIDKILEQ